MKCRLIQVSHNRLVSQWLWGKCTTGRPHRSEVEVGRFPPAYDLDFDDHPTPAGLTPPSCATCGASWDPTAVDAHAGRRYGPVYDTPTGKPGPGDMWWVDCYGNGKGGCVFHSEGCDGRHLFVITPDGQDWDIDGRASNCTRPDDDVHRCWVRHGEAPGITVDKRGNTCAAGAGSIAMPGYHGFLRNGAFTPPL